jgi:hypothetical protein
MLEQNPHQAWAVNDYVCAKRPLGSLSLHKRHVPIKIGKRGMRSGRRKGARIARRASGPCQRKTRYDFSS